MQQVGESGIQSEDTTPLGTVPVTETKIVSLMANIEKVREEATNTRTELDNLRARAESIAVEHQATRINVREERQGGCDSLSAAASHREANMAEMREEMLVEVTKIRSECGNAAASHHEL